MREVLYAEKQVYTEDEKELSLSYILLVSGGESEPESYGVKIVERNRGEAAHVLNVTMNAKRIENLLDMLTRNSVTPTGLMDVLADWL